MESVRVSDDVSWVLGQVELVLEEVLEDLWECSSGFKWVLTKCL